MSLAASRRLALAATKRPPLAPAAAASQQQQQQVRWHHPDPFNPKNTRGWKAAIKVRNVSIRCFPASFLYLIVG